MPRKSDNVVMDSTGETPLVIDSLETANQYIEGFMSLDLTVTSGYKKYVTHNGFSNPDFPKELKTQGLIMTALVCMSVLASRAVEDDKESGEALKLLKAYAGHAMDGAKNAAGAEILRKFKDAFPNAKIEGVNIVESKTPPKKKNKNKNKNGTKPHAGAKDHESTEPVGSVSAT